MSMRFRVRARKIWGAHAFRVLVSASRRNNLSIGRGGSWAKGALSKVRDRGDAFASTRDACAPQTINRRSTVRTLRPSALAYCAYR
jgi:hypothetical protein